MKKSRNPMPSKTPSSATIKAVIDSAARITYTVDGEIKGFAVQFEPVTLEVAVVDGNIDGSIKAAVTELFTGKAASDD